MSTSQLPDLPKQKYSAHAIVRRNEIAARIMKQHDVDIDDLYTAVKPPLNELQRKEDVHFHAQGYVFLGNAVARSLKRTLNKLDD